MHSTFYSSEPNQFLRCPTPSGIFLEAGVRGFRTELTVISAAQFLERLSDQENDQKQAFLEAAAAHPAYAVRLQVPAHLTSGEAVGRLLLDRSSSVRRNAFEALDAEPRALSPALCREIAAAQPDLWKRLPDECVGSERKESAVGERRSYGRIESNAPAERPASAKLVYEGVECPLFDQDLIDIALFWEPAQAAFHRMALFEALVDSPVWGNPEFRAAVAERRDLTRRMFERLRDDEDLHVLERLASNTTAWKRMNFEETLAFIGDDPKLVERFLIYSRSSKAIRRIAEIFANDPDPQIRSLCALRRKNARVVSEDDLITILD